MNPQLRRVSVSGPQSLNHLRSLSEYVPELERLMIMDYCNESFSLNDDAIHFKSVENLFIHFTYNPELKIPRINLLFDQLKEVEMNLDEYEVIDEAVKFFKNHQSITKLILTIDEKEFMMRIVGVLPLLNELDFFGPGFSVDDTINFLTEFKLMNRFCFHMLNQDEFERLETQLGIEWDASKRGNYCVELKRRT